ncbi:MetQ/NlpA family ABC transporter substrate-binding protein [Sediminibacillus albus]|uniref:Lipoprotein n=1 Tax=Sediminibacillus albus TaxID=407036 RepID=A0A1G8WSN3_9BACI|nr:MetQ/NlpA family ABC transporter substrate-binding protein [Sediminibacillus albus]SDJ81284.1 D-methionine transport system substrate-binding protein [Sediminibacillus albus]
MKKLLSLLAILLISVLAACGSDDGEGADSGSDGDKKEITFGATTGPYSDMVTKAIAPLLEEKGYKVENKEFTDYIQPNNSLANGDLDANLFQHKIYMESFAEENNMDLSEVIIVPTAPMGLYSNSFDSIEDIEDGSTIVIANDPTNLARTLTMLQDEGLITISDEVDPLRASVNDITENPKNLNFQEIEAGQLPRSVESEDVAAVPGNYALAADMDLLDALALEDMPDDYRNRVVVNTEDIDKQYVKDIKEVIESDEFEEIIDEEFQGFGKPQWMKE